MKRKNIKTPSNQNSKDKETKKQNQLFQRSISEERQFDSNTSYVDGRGQEVWLERHLQKLGFTVVSKNGSNKSYDFIIISPNSNKEYVAQIKSSKEKIPYIRCQSEDELKQIAKELLCEPLLILLFTLKKRLVILNLNTQEVLYTNFKSNEPLYQKFMQGQAAQFTCYNKQK